MATYVLIHGAWFGGWCWDATKSLLERDGHTAISIDLPGHRHAIAFWKSTPDIAPLPPHQKSLSNY
jgi:pimeloyl-ACP methyl ester carboxylesterase